MREQSGVAPGLSSLPSGGGGLSPLGDRFQPDLVKGSGSYGVQIPLPRGPGDFRPTLNLSYSTGSGNGAFGQGWRLSTMRIERRTDRGIPGYTDDDTFVFGDAEVLVPVGANRYRPKTDTQHWFIEREAERWRVRTGEGRILLFGQTPASREEGLGAPFSWYLDEERDAAGNSIRYSYRRDGARLYLDAISYSIFRIALQYEARPDVLRSGVSGVERRTALRCRAIELHCERLASPLMRSYAITYSQAANSASLLRRIVLSATRDGESAGFPPVDFAYSDAEFDEWEVRTVDSEIAPPGLDDPGTQLVDMTGDGLPDLLKSSGDAMYLWRNAGGGRLEGPTTVQGVPSTVALDDANVAFADLNGNGRVDLFAVDQPLQLVFESNAHGGFDDAPIVLRTRPSTRLTDGNTRLMDIDNDGVTDMIATGRDHLMLFRHDPGVGFDEPLVVQRVDDLDTFPDVAFADRGVRLADFSGDGLQDFVVLQSGNVSYWPYLGNAHWAPRVEMTTPPRFPNGYREDRLFLADVDGDGCADIVYADTDRTLIWLNQSGSGFAPPIEIPISLGTSGAGIIPCDLFGDGRVGFAWNVPGSGIRFLRFDSGTKPYLMTRIENGQGGTFEMEYSTSTQMRVTDRLVGVEWAGELPFTVHVVSSIRETDAVTGRQSLLTMRYHDGVYDGPEREFRGYTRVEVDNAGDDSAPLGGVPIDSVPTTRQEVTFFQGDPGIADLVERDRQRALAGSTVSTRSFERAGAGFVLRSESTQVWDARLEGATPSTSVFFPFVASITAREKGAGSEPDRVETTELSDYDANGNVGRRVRSSFAEGAPTVDAIRSEERYTYLNDVANWLVKLPVRLELRDGDGLPWAVKISEYDPRGLLTAVKELKLLESRLPAGYLGGRDLTSLGYSLLGTGDTRGCYATTQSSEHDARGNVIAQRDVSGALTRFAYDADGVYLTSSLDPGGATTTFVFEPRAGEPRIIAFADGRRIRYEYDAVGRLVASFDLDDAGTEQLSKAWVIDVHQTPAHVTSIAPTAGGRLSSEFTLDTDFAALTGVSISRIYYDGFGKEAVQVSSVTDDTGARRFVQGKRGVLNPRGLVCAQFSERFVDSLDFAPAADVATAPTRFRYGGDGNVIETAGPGPERFRVVRNSFSITHFEGTSPEPARVEHFDARARLVRIDEAVGDGTSITTSYELSLDGRVEVVRDGGTGGGAGGGGAEVVRYQFAGPGDTLRIRDRDAGSRTFYRDSAGRIREQVNDDGSTLFYRYDPIGRLIRVESQAAGGGALVTQREIFFDTDPTQPSAGRFLSGRIAVVREGSSEFRYSYNRAGRTTREESVAAGVMLATVREYDLQGRVNAVVYPDNRRLEHRLSPEGTVDEIVGVASDIRYSADGNIDSYTLANGVRVSLPRDATSRRLNEVSATRAGALLRRLSYGYDAIGGITSTTDELAGGVTEHSVFGYDGLHRLTSFEIREADAAGPVLGSGDYLYDSRGNILSIAETDPMTLQYGDAARPSRLTAVTGAAGSRTVDYGPRGHVRSFGDLATLEFDPMDRLARGLNSDGTELRFTYDPQSRRVLKEATRGGVTRRIRYSTGLYERHETHSLRHVYLGSVMIATERVEAALTTSVFYVADHHGTILVSTDDVGAVIHQQRYTAFGAARDSAAALDRYLGREQDVELGLMQLGARYYAPELGRFVSPDWWVLENPTKPARMPQGFNVYGYALNNPLVFKDPSGMWFGIDDLIVAAVGFVVGFVSGLIYGLANGQGWGSLLTALETGLTTAAGAWLGWTVGGPLGAVMGGMNGLLGGIHGIYDWGSVDGWFAFLSDSTWSLIGTSLGNVVHVINAFSDSGYREDLSRRQNRHVYERGFALKGDMAFTQGNVISNAATGGTIDTQKLSFIANHEELHIWQQRFFGPVFQATYVVWAVGGFIVASVYWLTDTSKSWGSLVETAAYYDNPFEYWAYNNDNNWPPSGINPSLAWG